MAYSIIETGEQIKMAFSDLPKARRAAYIDRATSLLYTDNNRREYAEHDMMTKVLARTLYDLEEFAAAGGGDDQTLANIIDESIVPVSRDVIFNRIEIYQQGNRLAEAVAVLRAFTNMDNDTALAFIKTGDFKAMAPAQYVRHRMTNRRWNVISSSKRNDTIVYWCEDAITGEYGTFGENELAVAPRPMRDPVAQARAA